MRLSLEDVTMRVGASDYLYPMSLAVEPGGITVLLGPTLAGKTSLMRLMAGLDVPTQGKVRVDGVDVTGVPVRKRQVAMVYQQFINYPSLTVFDNIASPLKLGGASGIEQTVTALARRLHIDHLLDRLPAQLSGGQQQRVALARALAKDAPLILLDEPLVNLDYKLREELREELTQLFQSGSSSVVYATTEPAEALLLGGHTAVLDRGRMLQYGRTIDVFMKPATIQVARAFSDPPINLVPAQLQRNVLLIDHGPKIALQGPLVTERPDVTVGIRAGDLRVEGHAGDVHFDARVELAEISGSDSFVHVTSRLGALVVQLVGVHRFELGQVLRLHVDPGAIYIFDHAGALLLAPELVQSRERLQARSLQRSAQEAAVARIELKALAHAYQRNPSEPADYALQPLELEWKDGGAYALLGPSGCGKTTLLNIISGLIRPSRGRVYFDGRDVTDLSPQQRNIAQVFQFPVVYDTMTVAQNLAFPLKNRGVPEDAIRKRVGKVAELLELSGELDRRASGLTADAKQKISLGRGLVREDVAAVLFDEPLTVIDPHLKWQLRRKLKQIHHELKLTLVYVTHDQVEALTFADQIMVMSDGRVMQSGTADQLFESPSHVFVGHFIGSPGMNFLPVSIAEGVPQVAGQPISGAATEQISRWLSAQQATAPDASLLLGIRPEYVRLAADGDAGTVDAVVERVQDLGTSVLVTARVGTASIKLRMPVQSDVETSLSAAGAQAAGRRLRLSVINSHSRFYRNQDLIT